MDRIREAICAATADLGEDFEDISARIGVEPSYLRCFVERGMPRQLPGEVCQRLADELGLPAAVLAASAGAPYTAGSSNVAPAPVFQVIAGGADRRPRDRISAPHSAAS